MSNDVRDLLFGDVPLAEWMPRAKTDVGGEPWQSFDEVRGALAERDPTRAAVLLQRIASMPGLESRQTLQAWHFLRQLGIAADQGIAKQVLGVVLDVSVGDGLDTLAAYADSTARYINHGGSVIVWDAADRSIGRLIDSVLRAGQEIADRIGPWDGPRRPAPQPGQVRLNLLTPSGLHFGEGPFDALSLDPMGGPLIRAGTDLMEALIERAGTSA